MAYVMVFWACFCMSGRLPRFKKLFQETVQIAWIVLQLLVQVHCGKDSMHNKGIKEAVLAGSTSLCDILF